MAHVLTYKEILDAAHDGKIIYEENRTLGLIRPLKFDGIDFVGVKHGCCLPLKDCEESSDYNLFYRCWNESPSEELMNGTPWKQNSYAKDFVEAT